MTIVFREVGILSVELLKLACAYLLLLGNSVAVPSIWPRTASRAVISECIVYRYGVVSNLAFYCVPCRISDCVIQRYGGCPTMISIYTWARSYSGATGGYMRLVQYQNIHYVV